MKGKGFKRILSVYSTAFLIALLFLAALFYSVIWDNAPVMVDDSPGYMEVARDLRDLSMDKLHGRVPGYPLLLLITGSAEHPSRVLFFVQLVIYMICVFILARFLEFLRVSGKIIMLFIVISLIPSSVGKAGYVLSECLTEFLLVTGMLSLLLWIDKRKIIFLMMSGLTLALSALIRPTYQLLFVMIGVLFLILILYDRRLRQVLSKAIMCISIFFVIILGGFALNNKVKFDYFGLAPHLGYYLSSRTVRFLERLPDQYSEVREILIRNRDNALTVRHSSHMANAYIYRSIPELRIETGMSEAELSGYLVELNLILIRRAPLNYLLDVCHSICHYWFPAAKDISDFGSRGIQFLWSLIHFLVIITFFVIILGFFGYGMILIGLPTGVREKFSVDLSRYKLSLLSFLIPLSFIVYTMLVSTLFEMGDPRYRLPTELMIYFASAVGADIWSKIRRELKQSYQSGMIDQKE